MSDIRKDLEETASRVHAQLEELLSDQPQPGERARPPRLMAAMRHGALNGGKRLRPFLVIQSAALFDVTEEDAMQTACALECLHCYSLVHDDLPAMDDDDLRRGQPTVHKAFDEATAILAGDGLLTLALDLITSPNCHPDAEIRLTLANLLTRAAGAGGMIGGQMLDIAAETGTPGETEIRTLQAMKTGALIRFACEAGAVLGNAEPQDRAALVRYGETIGLAFQLADDLLDVTPSTETMGKATGKDADRGKGTLVSIHGIDKGRAILRDLLVDADSTLGQFGSRADRLRNIARFIVEREK